MSSSEDTATQKETTKKNEETALEILTVSFLYALVRTGVHTIFE